MNKPQLHFENDTIGVGGPIPIEVIEEMAKSGFQRHKLRARSCTKKYVKRHDRIRKRKTQRASRRKNRSK